MQGAQKKKEKKKKTGAWSKQRNYVSTKKSTQWMNEIKVAASCWETKTGYTIYTDI